MEDKHLTAEEIVFIYNHPNEASEKYKALERHVSGCAACKKEYERFARLMELCGEVPAESKAVCEESGKAELFCSKRMNAEERRSYIRHLTECGRCREAVALLSRQAEKNARPEAWTGLKEIADRFFEEILNILTPMDVFYSPVAVRGKSASRSDQIIKCALPEGGTVTIDIKHGPDRKRTVGINCEDAGTSVAMLNAQGILCFSYSGNNQHRSFEQFEDCCLIFNKKHCIVLEMEE